MTALLRLLACQIAVPETPDAAARDRHLAQTAAKVRARLETTPVDLVVLPELSAIDYSRGAFDRLDQLAEPLDGVSWRTWAAVARDHRCHVAYGFARRGDDGRHFITIAVVGPDGTRLGHYDKLHLAQYGASMEKDYFSRGAQLFSFALGGLTIAPIICYDIRIPELCRTLTLDHGAGLILHCGAYFRDASFATWHPFAIARAMENQLFFLSLNRAGADYGNSVFCRPWMDETLPPAAFPDHAEDLRLIEIDPAEIDRVRAGYSFLADRLPCYDLPRG